MCIQKKINSYKSKKIGLGASFFVKWNIHFLGVI